LSVKLSLRRLPTITTTGCGLAMGVPFDAGDRSRLAAT
jgi:hypothetical protein